MSFDPLFKESRYDKYTAFEIYLLYVEEDDEEVLHELWLQMIPLIGMMLKKEFHSLDDSALEEFEADCILELQSILSRKMPPINSAAAFNGYLYSAMFKRTCLLLEREVREFQPKPEITFFRPLTAIQGGSQIFTKLFTKYLPGDILRQATPRIRFTGNERAACVFLLNCLVQGQENHNGALRVKYDIPAEKIPFFVDYARVLVRRTLYELRAI